MPKTPRTKTKSVVAPLSAPNDAQIEKKGAYRVIAFISGKEEKVAGHSLLECFDKLVKSNVVKGKCTLQVQKGKLRSSIQLSPMKVKRLYFNKTFRAILEKQLNLRLT